MRKSKAIAHHLDHIAQTSPRGKNQLHINYLILKENSCNFLSLTARPSHIRLGTNIRWRCGRRGICFVISKWHSGKITRQRAVRAEELITPIISGQKNYALIGWKNETLSRATLAFLQIIVGVDILFFILLVL